MPVLLEIIYPTSRTAFCKKSSSLALQHVYGASGDKALRGSPWQHAAPAPPSWLLQALDLLAPLGALLQQTHLHPQACPANIRFWHITPHPFFNRQ